MKKYRNLILVLLVMAASLSSCLKGEIPAPTVAGVKFYLIDENNQYQEVTNPQSGVKYTIGVDSNADIVVIWPGGERETMKKAGTAVDSTDINGNVVLKKSNHYSDWGLLRARGLKTSLNNEIGWSTLYQYPESGSFTLTVIATNHGYDSNDYDQRIFPFDVSIN
jgi:hypothetical protein